MTYFTREYPHKYGNYPEWCISPHASRHYRPVCHAWLTTVQCIVDFSTNLAEACSRCLSAVLQNFSPIAQRVYEMCYQNFSLYSLEG